MSPEHLREAAIRLQDALVALEAANHSIRGSASDTKRARVLLADLRTARTVASLVMGPPPLMPNIARRTHLRAPVASALGFAAPTTLARDRSLGNGVRAGCIERTGRGLCVREAPMR